MLEIGRCPLCSDNNNMPKNKRGFIVLTPITKTKLLETCTNEGCPYKKIHVNRRKLDMPVDFERRVRDLLESGY